MTTKYADFMTNEQSDRLMEEIRAEDEAYRTAFSFGSEHSFCDCDNCVEWWMEYDG